MPLQLLEVVYEGGDVLDVALARQRRILRSELGDSFATIDLRRKNLKIRKGMLQRAFSWSPQNVLIRGLSMADEAAAFFPKAHLFLDHLAQKEALGKDDLVRWAFRVRRVYAYSNKGESDARSAGCGRVSVISGPMLPTLSEGPTGNDRPVVGVLDVGDGALDVLIRMKKLRKEQNWDVEFVSTRRMGGVLHCDSELEVGEVSDLIVGPMDAPDMGGPHEPALLALSMKRALCTSPTSSFYNLPVVGAGGNYLPARRYEVSSYATAFAVYSRARAKYDSAFAGITPNPEALPRDLLSRI